MVAFAKTTANTAIAITMRIAFTTECLALSRSLGILVIDEDAKRVGIANDSPEFIPTLIARLGEESVENGLAQHLLARYVAEGPTPSASAREWESWWNENRPYLFFSDTGGFRWFVDPLAKERNVITTSLRGRDRASLPRLK